MASSFSEPMVNVQQFALRHGMKVGDFGTGTGHYARAAATIVGREGRVYAIDVQEEVLKHARLNLPPHGAGVVEFVWGDIERLGGTKLKDKSLDAAILANVLFQATDKVAVLTEARRVLRDGGRLLIIDWTGSYGGVGPAPEHILTEHAAEELAIGVGFHKEKVFRAGPHHYGLVFTE